MNSEYGDGYDRELWAKAAEEKGLAYMNQIRDEAFLKCKDEVVKLGIHFYVKVWIEIDHPDLEIEEMARIGSQLFTPEEIRQALKFRAARTFALLREGFIKLKEPA